MRFPPVKNYYSMGAPYVKSIDFSTVTSFTGNVVVGSSTYVFDTDFGWTPRSPIVKISAGDVANSFADCVNGFYGDTTPSVTQNPSAYARCFGTKVYLIGRLPNDNFTLTSTMTGETIATVSNGSAITITTTGGLTDTQLRASAVPVSTTEIVGSTWTSASGTITTGGAAQVLVAASATRKGFIFQNTSDTDMWIGLGVAAVASQPCLKILADEKIAFSGPDAPVTAINLYGATTGKTFTCYTR